VPSDDRGGLDDDGSVQQRRHKTIESDKSNRSAVVSRGLAGSRRRNTQLMVQEDNLGLQPRL
jgi:hypothetical protein